jgi:hypothetical protein
MRSPGWLPWGGVVGVRLSTDAAHSLFASEAHPAEWCEGGREDLVLLLVVEVCRLSHKLVAALLAGVAQAVVNQIDAQR